MRCPFCSADKEMLHVIDSRTCEGGRAIRRRRVCKECKKRFTTYERIEQPNRLMVIKKDGRRLPWDRAKIISGLERACFKRPVPETEILRIAEEVEEEVFSSHDREVPSTFVGELVTGHLRRVDQVAYVRFASVYRQFKTLEELVGEAQAVLDAQRYDVPGQGRLFIEPPGKAGVRNNGNGSESPEAQTPKRRGRKPKAKEAEPAGEESGT
ncbi:MAG TPA: transcriptional regulator NrdR [Tepidisphaeraceae bacterium]|nr:transcriptional regulator NrdR [Tepidisphaeraceae bacterium]